jgi:NAD(P)-dependent dehydrogenase (short-subunit alcohol dehydrogenase family)
MSDTSKRIVLTGVSRGLGHALVERFIDEGHTVFGAARSAEAIHLLSSQHGAPHGFTALDVTDDAQVGRWAGDVLAAAGPPDLLLNNAGMINTNAPLWQVPVDEFSQVIDTNIKGVANVIRHFVPAMVERGSGVIVNFSSGWGRAVAANVAPYCATKWAMEGLSRALAEELPEGMAAVPFDPGIINTDMLATVFGDDAGKYPDAETWSKTAAAYLLQLGPADNGEPREVPKPP